MHACTCLMQCALATDVYLAFCACHTLMRGGDEHFMHLSELSPDICYMVAVITKGSCPL